MTARGLFLSRGRDDNADRAGLCQSCAGIAGGFRAGKRPCMNTEKRAALAELHPGKARIHPAEDIGMPDPQFFPGGPRLSLGAHRRDLNTERA